MATPRPFTRADQEAVNALHRSVGWPDRSFGGWRWLEENPARPSDSSPLGWVIDGPDGRPQAFLGAFHQRLKGAAGPASFLNGFSLIVSPHAKGAARPLVRALLDQPGVAFVTTLNANRLSSPIYPRLGFEPVREPVFRLKLSWRLDPVAAVAARALRIAAEAAPALFADGREWLASSRLRREDLPTLPAGVKPVLDLSDDGAYGRFWSALQARSELIADRGPEVIRWRLADPDLTRRPILLGAWRGRDLAAVAIALLAKQRPVDPAVLEILDLQALQGEAVDAFPRLMAALTAIGRAQGAAKMRLSVVGPGVLDALGPWAERARREGGWGHGFERWADPADPRRALWRPTAFDGDYGFCLRPAPRGVASVRAAGAARGAVAARRA
ncbi:N-acetyltransferase [Brevundimonas balnearis]|uniref:N-acetyltransferase n=1 Tax=Brevundimonas balnearis TaxID=1572858 RepID=A0ABV6R2L9_9CAUL